MVAYNSHFDAAFMDHLFRSANKTWRNLYYYFILDIPSMAWGLGIQELTSNWIRDRYQVADESHIAEEHTGNRCHGECAYLQGTSAVSPGYHVKRSHQKIIKTCR